MRRFFTEREIGQIAAQGIKELVLEPNDVVTDLGQERARAAGIRLLRSSNASITEQELHAQVRATVIARLGSTPEGLDAIIARCIIKPKN